MSSVITLSALAGSVTCFLLYPLGAMFVRSWYRMVAQKKREQRVRGTLFMLSGDIEENNFISHILQLSESGREGVLHIFSGRRKGYILFRNSDIVDAFFRNTIGRDAMKILLTLKEGNYFFEAKPIYQPNLVRMTIETLLQESNKSD